MQSLLELYYLTLLELKQSVIRHQFAPVDPSLLKPKADLRITAEFVYMLFSKRSLLSAHINHPEKTEN